LRLGEGHHPILHPGCNISVVADISTRQASGILLLYPEPWFDIITITDAINRPE